MANRRGFRRIHLAWIIPLGLILILAAGFLIYSASYYHADSTALEALNSAGDVQVMKTDYGWFFDGPSEECALVFYPGAKVEETAYAPLLRGLAQAGMDACLVKMPLRFAFLGIDRAGAVMKEHDHARWFVGGHSLGAAMAAEFAAKHAGEVEGVILLGAHIDRALDAGLLELVIHGTEDGLATEEDIARGRQSATARYVEHAIQGGNHAQYGNYGVQAGDGTATISAQAQQDETVRAIIEAVSGAEAPERGASGQD